MGRQQLIALIRQVAPPDADVLQANARVLMSPMSTVEQLAALWAQVKAWAEGEGAREAEAAEEQAEAPVVRRLQLTTAKRMMRRYYLVQQAREG